MKSDAARLAPSKLGKHVAHTSTQPEMELQDHVLLHVGNTTPWSFMAKENHEGPKIKAKAIEKEELTTKLGSKTL